MFIDVRLSQMYVYIALAAGQKQLIIFVLATIRLAMLQRYTNFLIVVYYLH
jgi:hypothetical protein